MTTTTTSGIPTGTLMKGKKGLILGVANDRSIAWGIAQACAAQGADIGFTFQGEALEKRVRPLAESLGSKFIESYADATDESQTATLFEKTKAHFGTLDFVVHSIAFSDKNELDGLYVNTTHANFLRTMDISCFSFTSICKHAIPLMPNGGSLLTLSYLGAARVMPHYNVMGVAKAALEASVRYLAMDLGPKNIRVNGISAGPIKTLAASGIGDFRAILRWNELNAPLRRNVTTDDVGKSGMYLLSDLGSGVTGEIHYVDGGYNVTGMIATDATAENAELMASLKPSSAA